MDGSWLKSIARGVLREDRVASCARNCRKLGYEVIGKAIWTATSVHRTNGNIFGRRLEASNAFKVLGEMTNGSSRYNMRTLATAIRVMLDVTSCGRLIVPVDMRTIEESGKQYTRQLMTVPSDMRSKLFIELQTGGRPIGNVFAGFARAIQEEVGMSIVAWGRCGNPEYLESLMETLSPSILAIDGSCLKATRATGDRSVYIDAVECALSGGASVMAAGVDTDEELMSMEEIGVELVYGGLKSRVVDVEEGKFPKGTDFVAMVEGRKSRPQKTPA